MTHGRRTVLKTWAAVVIPVAVATAGGASARDAELLGNVAADTHAECPAGSAMVGIAGKAGATMVGLIAQCVRVDADLRWQETPAPGTLLGSDDPALGIQTATCVPDSFVTSIGASAAMSPPDLSMIWIQCGNRAGPQQTAGQSILFPLDPGAASVGLGVSRCTAEEVPVGIAGHAGTAIGALSLVCAPASSFGAAVAQTTIPGGGDSLLGGAGATANTTAPIVREADPTANAAQAGPGAGAEPAGPGAGAGPGGPGSDIGLAGPGAGGPDASGPGAGGGLDRGASAAATDPSANLPEDRVVQDANVRSAAKIDGTVVDTLSAGTSVHYAERIGTWCHVYYDGKNGWVSTTLIACGGALTVVNPARKSKMTNTAHSIPADGSIKLPGGITIHIGN